MAAYSARAQRMFGSHRREAPIARAPGNPNGRGGANAVSVAGTRAAAPCICCSDTLARTRHDRVLFVGTFSKVLAPGLRVGYLVSPLPLVGRFAEAARLRLPSPAPLIQATIAAFIEHGYLARHIRRMRQLYAERRAALVDALLQHARPTLAIDMERHGMHILARLPRGTDDVALVKRVGRDGIVVRPLSACGVACPYEPGLVIGFANVDARKAPDVARQLARNDLPSLADWFVEVEAGKTLSWNRVVGAIDPVVTFTLTPTATGTRLSLVQSGFKSNQKQNFGGARYGWKMMGGKLADLLEDPMSKFIRQSHRWLSIVFTLTVIANFVALAVLKGQQPPAVVTYSPLLPLFLLMFSGLYLFALPYTAKGRNAKRPSL